MLQIALGILSSGSMSSELFCWSFSLMSLLIFEILLEKHLLKSFARFCMLSIPVVVDLACVQGLYCRFGREPLYHFYC